MRVVQRYTWLQPENRENSKLIGHDASGASTSPKITTGRIDVNASESIDIAVTRVHIDDRTSESLIV